MAAPAPSPFRFAIALGGFVAGAAGQPVPPAEKTSAVPPVFTDPAAAVADPGAVLSPAPAPAPVHAISSGLAATISTALPQYQDPSAPPAAAPASPGQPKNQVPRLPIVALAPVTVRERRLPDFTERETYTKAGLKELAEKRYLSWLDYLLLNQGLDHFMTEKSLPMAKFEEAEDHARVKEEADLWKLDAMKDPDETPAKAP